MAGPTILAAGTILSAVGTFILNQVSAADPLVAQKSFADNVWAFYEAVLVTMDTAITMLFHGGSVPNDPNAGLYHFNITDMMKNGVWADPNTLSKVSDLNTKI